MELFQDVVRGPYAFLLVLQILIVSGLLLTLIWLIIQRLRESALKQVASAVSEAVAAEKPDSEKNQSAGAAEPVEGGEALGEPLLGEAMDGAVSGFGSAGEAAPLAAQASPMGAPAVPTVATVASSEAAPPSAANTASSEALAEKDREMKLLNDESITLKDKIKYLESRLMEYEIVQEEISNLSQLRVENERLKEELLQFQSSRKPVDQAAAPAGEPAPAADAPAASSAEMANPVLDNVSQDQIDNILKKLDQITSAKA